VKIQDLAAGPQIGSAAPTLSFIAMQQSLGLVKRLRIGAGEQVTSPVAAKGAGNGAG